MITPGDLFLPLSMVKYAQLGASVWIVSSLLIAAIAGFSEWLLTRR